MLKIHHFAKYENFLNNFQLSNCILDNLSFKKIIQRFYKLFFQSKNVLFIQEKYENYMSISIEYYFI
jgi:hypothetical protein